MRDQRRAVDPQQQQDEHCAGHQQQRLVDRLDRFAAVGLEADLAGHVGPQAASCHRSAAGRSRGSCRPRARPPACCRRSSAPRPAPRSNPRRSAGPAPGLRSSGSGSPHASPYGVPTSFRLGIVADAQIATRVGGDPQPVGSFDPTFAEVGDDGRALAAGPELLVDRLLGLARTPSRGPETCRSRRRLGSATGPGAGPSRASAQPTCR